MNLDGHRLVRRGTLLAILALVTTAAPALAAAGHAAPASAPPARYPHARAAVSFSLYQELLNQHLWTTSEAGQPQETRFNYELYYDEKGRGERAFRIRQQFLGADPAALDKANRMAWAINFYNYLVIERITDHLLIPGKKRQRYLSVRDIRPYGQDFFKSKIVTVDSVEYSLDEFEKHFLFDDFDRGPGAKAPPQVDPRVHFAIVCGAIGCPPLQPRAFRADSLDLQLDHAVRESLANPNQFVHAPGSSTLRISAIFYWYAADFGGTARAVAWMLPYLPAAERKFAEPHAEHPMLAQILWDWKLNQVVGWRFRYEMDKPIPGSAPADSS